MKNKRRTFLVRPKMQLKIILSMVIIATLMTSFIAFLTYISLERNEEFALASNEVFESYKSHLRIVMVSLFGLVITSSLAMMLFGIYITQKIAGPLVPIGKFIDQLKEGNYEVADIGLRKGDELVELANQLNDLKNTLKQRHKS